MKRLREAADVSLPALLEGVNRQRPAYQDFDREDVERHVEAALRSNAAEALSVLLSCKRGDDTELYPDDRLRKRGKDLVKIAVEAEAVECCLMLFSAIKKIEESSPEEVRPPRVWIISPKEALEMAQEQLQLAGRDEEGGGKRRVARALLYHAMRRPKGNNGLKPKDENRAIQKGGKFSLEADGVAVQWPEHRADMSAELCEAYGVKAGGYDISDGAEHVPVMWVNEMDGPPLPLLERRADRPASGRRLTCVCAHPVPWHRGAPAGLRVHSAVRRGRRAPGLAAEGSQGVQLQLKLAGRVQDGEGPVRRAHLQRQAGKRGRRATASWSEEPRHGAERPRAQRQRGSRAPARVATWPTDAMPAFPIRSLQMQLGLQMPADVRWPPDAARVGATLAGAVTRRGRPRDPDCKSAPPAAAVAPTAQVFKHKDKGWCLRTLSPIKKGDFIMEYVGEVISQEEHLIRTGRFPDLEDYLMDIAKPSTKIDAYLVRSRRLRRQLRRPLPPPAPPPCVQVRNIAAFAAFACRPAYANMEKKARFCSHWDKRVFHVAFLAKCNIQPGDELTYLRVDGPPPANSTKNCKCGAPGCNRKM